MKSRAMPHSMRTPITADLRDDTGHNKTVRSENREGNRRRKEAAHMDDLPGLLGHFFARDGRSLNRIAMSSLIDVGYLWRLRMGKKGNPSRDVLIRLALALGLEPEELDQL